MIQAALYFIQKRYRNIFINLKVFCVLIFVSIFYFCNIGIAAAFASVQSIPIRVDFPVEVSGTWPITTGVPFPKGMLTDITRLSLAGDKEEVISCQIDKTATWLDGSIRWVLLNFQGEKNNFYTLKINKKAIVPVANKGIAIKENNDELTINTGKGVFIINNEDALISDAIINGKKILNQSGKGATLTDNHGNKAILGGKLSEISTRFLIKGPMWTVLRKEGWYISEKKSKKIARGIVWMHFYGNSPYVKIVHRLVLTEDTNKVWFKDVRIHFSSIPQKKSMALFDVSHHKDGQVMEIPVLQNEQVSMEQMDFPHFMSKNARFSLIKKTGDSETELHTGSACGDWCSLTSSQSSFSIVLRELAEQYPKALTVKPSGITAVLWSGKSGKELDFRTDTLVRDYWGKWTKYADIGTAGVLTIPSNAQASAKTHTLWFLPHIGKASTKEIEQLANTASERVLSLPDSKWLCDSGTMGPPMLPKDEKKFPAEEKFISDFFDKTVLVPQQIFPLTGYIAWGSNPATRYKKDPETNEDYAVWWRISGLADYYLRKNTWTLYARSGERKYFDYGSRFNRFAGDMNMHHWDYGSAGNYTKPPWKVKGGFAYKLLSKGINLKGGEGPTSYPIYWRRFSGKPEGSGAAISNYLFQFYFTGDWDIWELAENFGNAVKTHSFMQSPKARRGAFVPLRYLTWLYSMNWDKQLGEQLHSLAKSVIDLDSPSGVSQDMPPGPLYKISRNAIALLDYYRLTEAPLARKGFLKMVDYQYRFELGDYAKPISYQNASGMYYTMAWRMSGEEKYLQLARRSLDVSTNQYRESPQSILSGAPYYSQCFNLHACLSMPVIMKGLQDYKDELRQLPVLKKVFESTAVSMAVFEKFPDQILDIEVLFNVAQDDHANMFLLDPDLKPVKEYRVIHSESQLKKRGVPGITPIYYHLEIPASYPAGPYKLGQKNQGSFTILDTNAKHVVLECPEGFWLEKDEPFYFMGNNISGHVDLFTNRDVKITKSDQTAAIDSTGKKYGHLSIPTNAKEGLWEIQSKKPAFIKFKNIPPYISFLSSERFFIPTYSKQHSKQAQELLAPSSFKIMPTFSSNNGIKLEKGKTLRFQRGKKLADGSYENFPGLKGTIEFYYKPDWSAVDLQIPGKRDISIPLFSAGDIQIRYRYGLGSRFYAFLDFLCGTSKYTARGKTKKYGTHARIFPKSEQLLHIAVTWDATDTVKEYDPNKYSPTSEVFHIFINGKSYGRVWPFPDKLLLRLGKNFADNFSLSHIPPWLNIGPGSGTYQGLRISDIVRYEKDFIPFTIPEEPDKSTKFLLQADEFLLGVNAQGQKIPMEYKKR